MYFESPSLEPLPFEELLGDVPRELPHTPPPSDGEEELPGLGMLAPRKTQEPEVIVRQQHRVKGCRSEKIIIQDTKVCTFYIIK